MGFSGWKGRCWEQRADGKGLSLFSLMVSGAISFRHVFSPQWIWARLLSTNPGWASVYIKWPEGYQGPLRSLHCMDWSGSTGSSKPTHSVIRTIKATPPFLNCALTIPRVERLVSDSYHCRLRLFFANDPWSWLWFWSYESSKADTQICYTDHEINTEKPWVIWACYHSVDHIMQYFPKDNGFQNPAYIFSDRLAICHVFWWRNYSSFNKMHLVAGS